MTSLSNPVCAPVLVTDLYQLTMVTAYFELGMEQTASFEFFVRELPPSRGFLLHAGLQQAIEYLTTLHFDAASIEWLAGTGRFKPAAISRLERMRFTGDVDAMPEGTVFFANEPVLRVTAPLPEAQFVESRLINLLSYQTMVASKAARCRMAAGKRRLVDFGMRRAHGAEAAVLASRANYIAGFDATATVEAGRRFAIPLAGTMAHSFVQAHDDEVRAFRDFATVHQRGLTLLIDTYDTLRAARKVVELVRGGVPVEGVRLDSGDIFSLAMQVRRILDDGGCPQVQIFVSGDLDEERIAELLRRGAPIGGFGVGTRLDVSADAPYLNCVYKLQEYAGRPRRKRSAGKATWPGRKQVFRERGPDGRIVRDVIGLADERLPGEPLLQAVLRGGAVVAGHPSLDEIRVRAQREVEGLPEQSGRLEKPEPPEVAVSPALRALADRVDREFQ